MCRTKEIQVQEQQQQQICTMGLPDFIHFARGKKRQLQERIIKNGQFDFLELQYLLSSNDDPILTVLLYEIIRHIINQYPREIKLNPLDQQAILILLHLCPDVTKIRDEDHFMLIHHLCMMETPDKLILNCLIMMNPASLAAYGCFGYFEATPLHLKLMKTETNYDMALYMLMMYPRAARFDTTNGKLPIHLALSAILSMETPLAPAHYAFVHHVLQAFPEGAFEVISEEINSLTLVSEDNEEGGNNQQQANESNSDDFQGVTVFIGQEQYKIETTILRWSPYGRVLEEDNLFLQEIFSHHVEQTAQRHLRGQWQRRKFGHKF